MTGITLGQRLLNTLGKLAYRTITLQQDRLDAAPVHITIAAERPFFGRIVQWLNPHHARAQRLKQILQLSDQLKQHYGEKAARSEIDKLLQHKETQPLTEHSIRRAVDRVVENDIWSDEI